MKTKIYTCLIVILVAQAVNAEVKEFKDIISENSRNDWYHVKENVSILPEEFLKATTIHFNIKDDFEISFQREYTDDLDMTHLEYDQTYKGIPIYGTEFKIHAKNGHVSSANGIIVNTIDEQIFEVDEEELYSICERFLFAENKELIGTKFEIHELGQIFFSNDLIKGELSNFKHSYKISLTSNFNFHNHIRTLIVDSKTKKVVHEIPEMFYCNTYANENLLYQGGIQTIYTSPVLNGFHLSEECYNPGGIETLDRNGNVYFSATNSWDATDEIKGAAQLHWSTEMFAHFLNDYFGRDSWDNNGARMTSQLNLNLGFTAGWDGLYKIATFGSAQGKKTNAYPVGLDIVGHEFTHGLFSTENPGIATNEGLYLTEAFCDIFGTLSEIYAETTFDPTDNGDWIVLDDTQAPSLYLRDLSDPYNVGKPDTYQSLDYNNTSDIYAKGSPIGYAFYLLANGGSGWNNHATNPEYYNVIGISKWKAAQIYYRALTTYLGPYSGYLDFKFAAIQAARDLYGNNCPIELVSVFKSFDAVGIYDELEHCTYINDKIFRPQEMFSENRISINVIPNPTNDFVAIKLLNYESENLKFIEIFNSNGLMVHSESFKTNSTSIDISTYPSGVYFFKLRSNGLLERGQIVKISD